MSKSTLYAEGCISPTGLRIVAHCPTCNKLIRASENCIPLLADHPNCDARSIRALLLRALAQLREELRDV